MTPMQRLRIRARSGVADETLKSYLDDPRNVRDATRVRIEAAARAEGIDLAQSLSEKPPAPGAA
jgi:hypothetical protein